VGLKVFKADRFGGSEPMKGMVAIEFLLAGIGAVALFSASWYFARTVFDDPFRIWRRQIIWMILGVCGALFIGRMPTRWIKKSVPALVWITIVLNLLTYVPGIGYVSGGARRWIELGSLTFQPSELTRIVLVLYLARMLEKNEHRLNNIRDGLLPPVVITGVLVMLVYFQNDFSTTFYLLILSLGLFFVAGVPSAAIIISGIIGVLASVLMVFSKPYRLARMVSWFNPAEDPAGAGYQLLKARSALERGGFWGRGLGLGEVKTGGLPSAHSDFVVAVIGEEAGLVGVVAVLILFTLFAIKGWLVAESVGDTFSRWAIFGLVLAIYWQVLINFAVVSGLVPATGIPLPLFSAGGSAATMTILSFGLIFNLSESGK
jgi:cell division protein FtsW